MLNAARPRPPAAPPLQPGALHGLYAWLDALPLRRRKRHLARDFSDGVMLAEVVKLFRPRLVDLHNYVPTCNTGQKRSNWNVLNRKVFHKLGLTVSEEEIRKVVVNTPGAIEPILCAVRDKVEAGEGPPGMAGHRLLEEKEQALTVLQETIKVLQMKVSRLEHLVKLKDQRIEALMRQGDQPRGGGTPGRKGPLPCPPDSNPEPTWKSPRLGVSGCGHALSIRLGAQRRARAGVSTSRGLAPPDCTSRVPSQCGLRFPCCPPPPCHLPPPRPVWI